MTTKFIQIQAIYLLFSFAIPLELYHCSKKFFFIYCSNFDILKQISMIVFFMISLCSCSTLLFTTLYSALNTQEPSMLTFGDFYPQWAVLNSFVFTPAPDLKTVRFYKNGSLSGTYGLQNNNQIIKGHFLNDNLSSRYFALDFGGIFRVYQNENFTLTYTSPAAVQDITFASLKTEIVYIMSSTHKMYKLDCTSYSIVATVSLSHIPLQVVWSGMKLFVYSVDSSKPNEGYITIYSENFTYINQLVGNCTNAISYQYLSGTTFSFKTNHTLNMEKNGSCLVRSYWKTVQVWDITSGQLIHVKSFVSQIYQAFICKKVLAVLLEGSINFYQFGTWAYYKSQNYTFGNTFAYMKCFEDQSTIGVYSPNSNLVIQYIQFYQGNSTNNTNTTNTSNTSNNNTVNTTNTTNTTNTSNNNTGNNSTWNSWNTTTNNNSINATNSNLNGTNFTNNGGVFNISNSTLNNTGGINSTLANSTENSFTNLTLQQSSQLVSVLSQILNSSVFTTSASIASQVVAIATASNLGSILRPFSSLIEEFVFYGYHSKIYSSVVQIVTHQADILNQLRIKPKFMDFKVFNPHIDQENQLYLDQSSFALQRAPNSIYFTDFLKQTALQNFILATSIYILYILLYKLATILIKKFPIWKLAYFHLYRKVVWWNFFMMLFSFNIRTFSFYCFAQLSIFVNYEFDDKFAMILTVFLLFLLFMYTFTFYFLVFRFEKPRFSKQVLQICKFGFPSYALEMCLNCVRGFSQSFVHGSFTNRHQFQIFALILIDIVSLMVALLLRKQFNNKIMGTLVLGYLSGYLAFDIYLALYSFNYLPNHNFDLAFTIIFFSLVGITMLKILFFIMAAIFQGVKSLRKSNRIKLVSISVAKKVNNRQKLVVEQIPPLNKCDQLQRASLNRTKSETQEKLVIKEKTPLNLKITRQKPNLRTLP